MGIIDVIGNAFKDYANREKIYRSWDEASRAAKTNYSDSLLTDFRVARSREYLGKEEEVFVPSPALSEVMDSAGGRFVDFGGAVGEMCSVLQRKHPNWSFTVVETKAMARAATPLRPSIEFTDEIPDEMTVFHSSGTLQCIKDSEDVWESALKRTERYACLARNAFARNVQYRVQHSKLFDNGGGPVPHGFDNIDVFYPHRTISEKRIVDIAAANGFDLIRRIENQNSGVVSTAKGMYGADLLFQRR